MQDITKKLIKSVKQKNHFFYCSFNHGFWDILITLDKIGIDPNKLNQDTLDKLINENILITENIKDYSIVKSMLKPNLFNFPLDLFQKILKIIKNEISNENYYYIPGSGSFPNSEKLCGTPIFGTKSVEKCISKYNHNKNILFRNKNRLSGVEFKEMLIDGSLINFFNQFKKSKIILIGNKSLKNFKKITALNIENIFIHHNKAAFYLKETETKIRKKIEEGVKFFFIGSGSNSLVLGYNLKKLIINKSIKFYDLGLVPYLICNFESHEDPILRFYRNKIYINSLSKLNFKLKDKKLFNLQNKIIEKNFKTSLDQKNKKKDIIFFYNKINNFSKKKFIKFLNLKNNQKIFVTDNLNIFFNKIFNINTNYQNLLSSNIDHFKGEKISFNNLYLDLNVSGKLDIKSIQSVDPKIFSALLYETSPFFSFHDFDQISIIKKYAQKENKIFILKNDNSIFYTNIFQKHCDIELLKLTSDFLWSNNNFYIFIINKSCNFYDNFKKEEYDLSTKKMVENYALIEMALNSKYFFQGQKKRLAKATLKNFFYDVLPNSLGSNPYFHVLKKKNFVINKKQETFNFFKYSVIDQDNLKFPNSNYLSDNLISIECDPLLYKISETDLEEKISNLFLKI